MAAKVGSQQATIKRLQQRLRRTQQQLVQAKGQNAPNEEEPESQLAIRHDYGKRITLETSLRFAIRRSFSHIAAKEFGATLMVSMSAQSVLRSEVLAAASLQAERISWHRKCEAELRSPLQAQALEMPVDSPVDVNQSCAVWSEPPFRIALHAFRGDATNKAKDKVHSVEVRSAYILDTELLVDDVPILDAATTRTCLCDMQHVVDSSHKGTHSLLSKQLRSVGCPSWRPVLEEPNAGVIEIFAYTSDRGSDQAKVRKVMNVEVLQSPSRLFVDSDCMMHASQLSFRSTLSALDTWLADSGRSWRFFSSLAKLSNLWRERARAVFKAGRELFGIDWATDHVRVMVPACISGRWGSVAAVEDYFLKADLDRVRAILRAVSAARQRYDLVRRRWWTRGSTNCRWSSKLLTGSASEDGRGNASRPCKILCSAFCCPSRDRSMGRISTSPVFATQRRRKSKWKPKEAGYLPN